MSTTSLCMKLGNKRKFIQFFKSDDEDVPRDEAIRKKPLVSGMQQVNGICEKNQNSKAKTKKEYNKYGSLFNLINKDQKFTQVDNRKVSGKVSEPGLMEKVSTRSSDSFQLGGRLKKRDIKAQQKLSFDLVEEGKSYMQIKLSSGLVKAGNKQNTNWNSNIIHILDKCSSKEIENKEPKMQVNEETVLQKPIFQPGTVGKSNQIFKSEIHDSKTYHGQHQIKSKNSSSEELKLLCMETLNHLNKINNFQEAAAQHAKYHFNKQKIKENTQLLYSKLMEEKISELNEPLARELQLLVDRAIDNELNNFEATLQQDFSNAFNSLMQSNQF